VGRPARFAQADIDQLALFASQASLALAHDRVSSDLRRLELIEDRERIGRDLHDTVIQRLFATGLSLQAAIRRVDGQSEIGTRLEQAVDDIDTTVKEIRSTIFALQAGGAPTVGIRSRVLQVIEELGSFLPRPPRVRFDGPIDSVATPEVGDHLIPVVREALTNVAKHAAATDIEVELSADQQGLRLRVTDDGRGISGSPDGGSGLRNLRERAAALGGELAIGSGRDGRGTTLVWRVPGR
jgi:signal transduction histidine kinase